MPRGISLKHVLRPMDGCPIQSFLGRGVHTLGVLGWILEQTGRAEVYISTFSTSDAFLRGFFNLRKKKLISHAVLLADLKASRKTVMLYRQMQMCFDDIHLCQNHSKVLLVQNDRHLVTVISSQNQTYGDRAESTLITTDQEVFLQQYSGFKELIDSQSVQINGLFNRQPEENREAGESADPYYGDWRPFGF